MSKRPAHRPPLAPEVRLSETVLVRMTSSDREKLQVLGGVDWIRRIIRKARVTDRRTTPT